MRPNKLLVYGGTGYSGRMIADAVQRSFGKRTTVELVFAGRDKGKVHSLARSLAISTDRTKVFEVTDDIALDDQLRDAKAVLNLAGPFPATAPRLAKAAIRNGAHYMDIAGEFEVFRYLDNLGRLARDRSVFIMPGSGFAVVATDLLANFVLSHFKQRYPEIDEADMTLRLALCGIDHMSRGSVATALAAAREGVPIRRRGVLTNRPVGGLERTFDFGDRVRLCSAVRLPDVVTAFHSTRIGSIEAYYATGPMERAAYQMGAEVAIPMQLWPWRQLLRRQIQSLPEGPTREVRDRMAPVAVVEIEDRYRRTMTATWKTIDPYTFTARAVVALLKRLFFEPCDAKGFIVPSWLLLGGRPAETRTVSRLKSISKEFLQVDSSEGSMEIRSESNENALSRTAP